MQTKCMVNVMLELDLQYNKLSYHRDSVRRQSLRRSRPFKVTDASTNRKPLRNLSE